MPLAASGRLVYNPSVSVTLRALLLCALLAGSSSCAETKHATKETGGALKRTGKKIGVAAKHAGKTIKDKANGR